MVEREVERERETRALGLIFYMGRVWEMRLELERADVGEGVGGGRVGQGSRRRENERRLGCSPCLCGFGSISSRSVGGWVRHGGRVRHGRAGGGPGSRDSLVRLSNVIFPRVPWILAAIR